MVEIPEASIVETVFTSGFFNRTIWVMSPILFFKKLNDESGNARTTVVV